MTNEEQGYSDWCAEQQRRAQAHAFIWAERATNDYSEAVRYEDSARRGGDSAYLRDAAAEERRLAQFHGVRSTEALKLATMWARVAGSLTPPPEPLELVTADLGGTVAER